MQATTLPGPREEAKARFLAMPVSAIQRIRFSITALLLLCVVYFAFSTRHWPEVNDPAQISYLCFLMDHGRAPYKDITEMNMPGIYLANWSVMHVLGEGPAAWRVFDFSLLAAMAAAMIAISLPYDWLGGLLAGVLFALVHGRDGPAQSGQRDLIIAVLLVCGCACLFRALRSGKLAWLAGFGFSITAAASIKPLPLALVLAIPLVLWRVRQEGRSASRALAWMTFGFLVPLAVVAAFLLHERAFSAFVQVAVHDLPYYAHLGRRSVPYLLEQLDISSITRLTLLLIAAAIVSRGWRTWEGWALVAGIAFGFFHFFAQGKGFPYHRYPLLAFLLLWGGIVVTVAVREEGKWARRLGWAGLVVAAGLAPFCAARAAHKRWQMDYIDSLTPNLEALGGSKLSGRVQCMAMQADCDTVLYRMRLVQATGLAYDYFVFGNGAQPVVADARQRFQEQLQQNPPEVFVISKGLFPSDLDDYQKLALWPYFSKYLGAHYILYTEREFAPTEAGPSGYRVYVRRSEVTSSSRRPDSVPQRAASVPVSFPGDARLAAASTPSTE